MCYEKLKYLVFLYSFITLFNVSTLKWFITNNNNNNNNNNNYNNNNNNNNKSF